MSNTRAVRSLDISSADRAASVDMARDGARQNVARGVVFRLHTIWEISLQTLQSIVAQFVQVNEAVACNNFKHIRLVYAVSAPPFGR